MAKPKSKSCTTVNEDDLIIDCIADVIIRDISKDNTVKITPDDSVDMRQRLVKFNKISKMWYEQKAVEESGKKLAEEQEIDKSV